MHDYLVDFCKSMQSPILVVSFVHLRTARSHGFCLCYLACGEPPMCMSCSVLFAVKKAIDAARTEISNKDLFTLCK